MREITELKELQKIELEMLQEIDKICRHYHIRYYLAGGTLLGAVRHQGFIPWDDDIDIAMPREDYEQFIKIMSHKKHPIYKLLAIECTKGYPYTFAKVVDTRTRLVEEIGKDLHQMGVFIDIFPIDGMGNQKEKAMQRLMKIIRLRSRIWEAALKKDEIKNKERNLKNQMIKSAANGLIKIIGIKRCYHYMMKYVKQETFQDSKWIASAVGGAGIEREVIERKYFDNMIEMEFEGKRFYAPEGYEKYLTNLYGDYMQMPPKEKRVASHRGKIWWK